MFQSIEKYNGSRYKRPLLYLIKLLAVIVPVFLLPVFSFAHQAPYSVVYLDVNTKNVAAELDIPLTELELAYGNSITQHPETLTQRMGGQLKEYILAHTHAFQKREQPWLVEITAISTDKEQQIASGPPFWELRVHLLLHPQNGGSTRDFMLDYDAVVHQVANHVVFVVVRSDWETGRADALTADSNPMTIRTGSDNKVHPLEIVLQKGSSWVGFVNMFWLGTEHIKTGTDHLLFIITLLLPACLRVRKGSWGRYGGWRYSLFRLLKMITAFTVGHSITLLLGALGVVKIPVRLIEVTIAVSILVSAIHAIKPLFYGKEIFIALGFGLIHGLAFSETLQNLHLTSTDLAVSVLGFNLGIEAMQVAVIAITIPWFIVMSQTPYFKPVKNVLAALVCLMAIGWILQRSTATDNFISTLNNQLFLFSPWPVILLCIISAALVVVTKTAKRVVVN